jgi:hypothetical protein
MMLSTLEEYFKGNHELFKGLAVDQLEPAESEGGWKKHIVFHFDFASGNFTRDGINVLHDRIKLTLNSVSEEHDLPNPTSGSISFKLETMIRNARKKTGLPVVVLFDEYDQPLNQNLMDAEKLLPLRDEMRAFFATLKSSSSNIRFAMLTGVTKFSGVTLFSGINQLFDISMSQQFADICGITQVELENNFSEEIQALGEENQLTYPETIEKMREYYDGYNFAGNGTKVYNPFSTVNILARKEFDDIWYASGSPSFLIQLIENMPINLTAAFQGDISFNVNMLKNFDPTNPDLITLLYQTGYLTIVKKLSSENYQLGFPNQEVRQGFLDSLATKFAKPISNAPSSPSLMGLNLLEGNIETFIQRLSAFYTSVPYFSSNNNEADFQSLFFAVISGTGLDPILEKPNSTGAADAIVLTNEFIYIFEFKINPGNRKNSTLAKNALKQIENQGYAKKYELDPSEKRSIFKIGIVFDMETKTIGDWAVANAKN